ncbi:MAG: hypothetical protein ACK4Z9_07570, partial [Thermodesulfovibrionales bacterium]
LCRLRMITPVGLRPPSVIILLYQGDSVYNPTLISKRFYFEEIRTYSGLLRTIILIICSVVFCLTEESGFLIILRHIDLGGGNKWKGF